MMNEAMEEDDIDALSLYDDNEDEDETVSTTKKKKKNCKKRRFSDEQVRSLETIFELETKLEPKKKIQVARELGLQPRQVAIWFQNKRARWKSKEIEKNYRLLKLNFDHLKAKVDVLRKDKESLLIELQELRSVVDKQLEQTNSRYEDVAAKNNLQDNKTEQHTDNEAKLAAKSSISHEEIEHQSTVVYSDDDKSGNMGYLYGQEQPELLSLSENIDGSITSIASPVKWCSFDAGGISLFDQSSSSSHWWESWT